MNKVESELINEFNAIYMSKIKDGWRWLFAMGVFFIIVGILSIFNALTTTIVSLYVLGFVILFSGLGYINYSFKFWKDNWTKFFRYLILGVLYLIASFIIIENPIESAFPLTFFIAMFYIFVVLW